MIKLFLRTNADYFCGLSDKLKNDMEVYEILTAPSNHIKENTIQCCISRPDWMWEHEGMAIYGWQFQDMDMVNYADRIIRHIDENDDVIIIFPEEPAKGYPFYNTFLKFQSEIRFHLHAVMYTYQKVRDIKDDTGFLRLIPNVNRCDSVTVMNIADWIDLGREYNFWIHPSVCDENIRDSLITANELFEDELVEMIRNNNFSALHSDTKSVFIYNHHSHSFQKHILQDFEIAEPVIEKNNISEFITPNKGRETCRYLRKLRKHFCKVHSVKKQETVCTYNGECKGVCKRCDYDAESMWKSVYGKKYGKLNAEKDENHCVTAEICGISRLRIDTDGNGIRSLVVFDSCPLKCQYCINKSFVNQLPTVEEISVSTLFIMLQKDLVYFEETGGGVTFGGGEPLLYADFIAAFKKSYPFIHVIVQTSLNTDFYAVESLIPYVDEWHIDIKDMNTAIYRAYTGEGNGSMIENLKMLVAHTDRDKIICRVPHIPDYNTPDDVILSIRRLKEMGVVHIDEFEYMVK